MAGGHRLGRDFGWLRAAYGTSALGTWLAFGALPLIAIQVLHAGPAEVALLSSVSAAVGAAAAVPLGPWVEFRRKRPVLITADLARCAALLTIPAAYALGVLSLAQLLAVATVVATADITYRAASGPYLKTLLAPGDLLTATARLESTAWTITAVGPPLGGAAIALLGPVATVTADAVSHLLSAFGIRAVRSPEPRPSERTKAARMRAGDLLDGWRHILSRPTLRPLFLNTVLFNALVMATEPLLAVLMLGQLGFAPWQYAIALTTPAIAGPIGARLAPPLAARYGRHRVLLAAGALRAPWPIALALPGPGTPGLALVMAAELGLILSCALFNPLQATYRLQHTPTDRLARTLTAWTVTTKAATALLTAVWGALAVLTGPRTAIALAGLLVLATPFLLPRPDPEPEPSQSPPPSARVATRRTATSPEHEGETISPEHGGER
ncbi:MFS transporter [Kitasatospora sp. NPDC004240]